MLEALDLRCEYERNPRGLGEKHPRFGWKISSDRPFCLQGTYRLQVSRDSFFTDPDWDSGEVRSGDSQFVAYGGKKLKPRTRYYWRVLIADREGQRSDWSEAAWWETALPEGSWAAPFVAGSLPETGRYPRPQYLRTEFLPPTPVAAARVYAGARGMYELWINGKRVGDELFSPGWTNYRRRMAYRTWDVSDLLGPGPNAIGAVLADGWYAGDLTWLNLRHLYGERTAFSLDLYVRDRRGRERRITLDRPWKAGTGPIRYSELYHGEIYDARLEDDRWCRPGYDDSAWSPTEELPFDPTVLVAQDGPPVRRQRRFPARELIVTPRGERVLDFGQNLTGWVAFAVRGERGDRVVLRHGEILDRDGNFYDANMRSARNRIEYVLKGGGEENFEPHFTFQGFRYALVEEYPGSINLTDFAAWAIHSEMESTLEFSCSRELLNRLHHNIEWSWRGNAVDIPSDCPQRDERLGWTGDAQVFIGTAAYLMGVGPFFRKWLRDLASEQLPDGGVPFVVPDVLTPVIRREERVGASHSSTGWGDAATVCPWTIYERYGDRRLLAEQYPSMKAWTDYIRARARRGLIWDTGFHFGDWVALDAKEGSYFGATPNDLTATAYYAWSAELVARAAEVLGKKKDAAAYRRLAAEIVAAFRAEFFTPAGRLAARTQTAHVLALVLNLVPDRHRRRCADDLAALIKENGGHLTTGFLGTPWILRALSENGHLDTAYELLLKEDFPSWLFQVQQGATTVWEHWDGMKADGSLWSKDMNSFNHYAYGAVGEWLYRTIGGLSPDAGWSDREIGNGAGWRSAVYRPQVGGGVQWSRIAYTSLYGTHRLEWRQDDGGLQVAVTVPENTRGTIILPGRAGEIQAPAGVIFADTSAGAQAGVGSGTYFLYYRIK